MSRPRGADGRPDSGPDPRPESGADRPPDCSQGLHQLEGYLLWQGEIATAGRQAEAFADQLPWLTGTQREEVVRIYTDDRLEVSRATIRRIADRARELQHEYSARYRALQIRLLALFVVSVGVLGTVQHLLGDGG